MAAPADFSSIFAALAAQRTGSAATQAQPSALPPGQPLSHTPQGFQINPTTGAPLSGFALPQPVKSGSLDLSAIKPVNTGSVSITDAIAKAKGIAAERGGTHDLRRSDPRAEDRYRRSRSRSRSPPGRRDSYRDSFNPYRDERRDDARRDTRNYRDRSRSPAPRSAGTFSPPRNARERSPVDDSFEIIAMDSSLVGLVIGRQGENLRRVETETKTRIQFITGPDGAGPQRQCRVTGDPHARADAKREINRIIDENGGNPVRDISGRGIAVGSRGAQNQTSPVPMREGDRSIQIMVPDRTVGLIIGRGGETIRDLQERSGCHVNIVGENKSVNGLRPVNLIGSAQAAGRAKELILEIVDSDTRALTNQGSARDQVKTVSDSYMDLGGGKISEKIMVPSEAVGMIIGKGGETIKLMQNDTGCKINVTPPSGADVKREIGLVGTKGSVEEAKRVLWSKVDTVIRRDKNAAAAAAGSRKPESNFSGGNDSYGQNMQAAAAGNFGGMGAGLAGAGFAGAGTGAGSPYAQGVQQAFPQQGTGQPAPGNDVGGADPYAAWGGYQNYAAMWYAALAQQQQQGQQGQQPLQQQQLPGQNVSGDQSATNVQAPGT